MFFVCLTPRLQGTKQIDYPMLWRFALYTALTTPPNLSFQGYLEDCFPSTTVRKRSAKGSKSNSEKKTGDVEVVQLDTTNTLAKFVLDQTVSASVNTAMFIAVMGLLQAKAWEDVHGDVIKVRVCMCKSAHRGHCFFWGALFC